MTLSEQVAKALGGRYPVRLIPLQGGDLSEVLRADLRDGGTVAVKRGPRALREADMLRALAAGGIPVPGIVATTPGLLILDWLPAGRADAAGWAALGAALRRLHDTPAGPDHGWAEDDAFGAVHIPNAPLGDWAEFWAKRRLEPMAPILPADLRAALARLCLRLPDLLPRTPVPGLLHGDLWGGNILESGGVPVLIDPACYRGHGEADLAMLHLFGQPPAPFLQAYGALEPGWAERRHVYQLWPALVHLQLFGTRYLDLVRRLLRPLA